MLEMLLYVYEFKMSNYVYNCDLVEEANNLLDYIYDKYCNGDYGE